jgi:hypothetical protein
LVPEWPFGCRPLRFPASRRSIVAADIPHSFAACASSRSGSPQARSRPTICDEERRPSPLPAGTSITAHILRNARITSSPYTGAPALRGAGTRRGPSASRNALRTWSRCHPVSSHNLSRTLALGRPRRRPVPRRRGLRDHLGWAHRQSHVRGWPDPNRKRRRHAVSGHFYLRQRSLLSGHLW